MIRTALFLLIFSLSAGFANSQAITLKGKLSDKGDNSAIAGANITLTSQRDSTKVKQTVTDKSGNFSFSGLNASCYVLFIDASGYEKIQQRINLQASNNTAIPFTVAKMATELQGVTVTAKTPPVRQKVDTTEFSASQTGFNSVPNSFPGIFAAPITAFCFCPGYHRCSGRFYRYPENGCRR